MTGTFAHLGRKSLNPCSPYLMIFLRIGYVLVELSL
jgi:hypothetical protein